MLDRIQEQQEQQEQQHQLDLPDAASVSSPTPTSPRVSISDTTAGDDNYNISSPSSLKYTNSEDAAAAQRETTEHLLATSPVHGSLATFIPEMGSPREVKQQPNLDTSSLLDKTSRCGDDDDQQSAQAADDAVSMISTGTSLAGSGLPVPDKLPDTAAMHDKSTHNFEEVSVSGW